MTRISFSQKLIASLAIIIMFTFLPQLSDQDELNKLLFQVKYDESKLSAMYLYDAMDNGFIFGGTNTSFSTKLTKEACLQSFACGLLRQPHLVPAEAA
jgi:hypothetical protein